MILDLIVAFLSTILTPLLSALPEVELPFNPLTVAVNINGPLTMLDNVVPFLDPLRGVMGVYTATFAGLLAFRAGLFFYKRLRG